MQIYYVWENENEMFDNYTLKIQTAFIIMKLYRLMKSE